MSGAIAAVFTVPQMTSEQYDRIVSTLEAQGLGAPDGRLSHVASRTPDGWLIVDVWESEEKLLSFSETLAPIVDGIGVQPPQPQVHPVYNTIP